jgi:CDP-diacylglycerol pyrophosphatase
MMRDDCHWSIGTRVSLLALAVVGMVAAAGSPVVAIDRAILWTIVHGICVPNWQQQQRPDPCASVDLKRGVDQGTAALINPLVKAETLVMPTRPIAVSRAQNCCETMLLTSSEQPGTPVKSYSAFWARRFHEMASDWLSIPKSRARKILLTSTSAACGWTCAMN